MGLTSLFMDGGVQRGTHASFDQLVEIVDAVGDRIDVS
jgi:isopentenyl diphosphate isomerase/L-lactate dehydrogenase-like FMN-dependent dehydrogenase